jgi:predicted dehydrogenase
MAGTRLRVGIVGCGQAAQIMHLPSLALLRDDLVVTALADPSGAVAEGVGARFGVERRLTDWRELVGRPDVDAVLVTAPNAYHAEVTLAALEAGHHVLVEKPLCLTRREADAVVAAQERTGLVVQVGYMRRYAAAFLAARARVAEMGTIRLARVRNLLGVNELIADQANALVRPDRPATDPATADQEELVREELGAGASPGERRTYVFLLNLCTHDLSAMRDLLGMPDGLLYATRRDGPADVGPLVTAAFDYGGFVCHLEAGFDLLPRVEQDLQVYGVDRVVAVSYDSCFVRNLPVRATITEAVGTEGTATTELLPTWEDPFVSEWRAFHASVTGGAPVRASAADARLDLDLCRRIAAATATSIPEPIHA